MSREANLVRMGSARFWVTPCRDLLPSPGRRPSPGQLELLLQAYHSPSHRTRATLLSTMHRPCSFR